MLGFLSQFFNKVPNITPKQVRDEFAPGKALLIDVRTPEEYKKASIRGSILLPVDIITREIEKAVPNKQAKLFIYCNTGNRSGKATQALREMGYDNTFNMVGGIEEWKKLGYPVM